MLNDKGGESFEGILKQGRNFLKVSKRERERTFKGKKEKWKTAPHSDVDS